MIYKVLVDGFKVGEIVSSKLHLNEINGIKEEFAHNNRIAKSGVDIIGLVGNNKKNLGDVTRGPQ